MNTTCFNNNHTPIHNLHSINKKSSKHLINNNNYEV